MSSRLHLLGVLLLLCSGGCDSGPSEPPPPDGKPRSYRMGWFVNAPRATDEAVLATIDSMANVADVALLQEPPPWERLLDGTSVDEIAAEKAQVADYLRTQGMEVAYLADPLDGLDRTSEPAALVGAGRSILEPEIRALHEEWVRAVVRDVQPRWMGLASEINTLAQHGDSTLYTTLVEVINGLAPDVRQIAPNTEVFVSFQVEDAWGLFGPSAVDDPFTLVDDFDVDFLGLSSYAVFAFDTPADVPENYFRRFQAATDLPLGMVEGGWSSASTPWADADPAEQRQYFERYEALLDEVSATLWIGITYADLDVASYDLPDDREEALTNFAHMGIADADLRRKSSYGTWKHIFERPLP